MTAFFHRLPAHAIIHPHADVSPRAVVGGIPESRDLYQRWQQQGRSFDQTTSYGKFHDVIVGPNARIGCFATVDGGVKHSTVVNGWVFKHAHVGHDCRVEEGAEISTGAVLGGHVTVGAGARVGLGAVVLPWRKIGDGAVVGAGSVVTKDVPAGEVWAGNPARFMRKVEDA